MTRRKTLKKRIRAIAAETGRKYTSVHAELVPQKDRPPTPDLKEQPPGPTEIPLELRELTTGERLFFRTPGISQEEWFRSRETFGRLARRLMREVERRHPELMGQLVASLALVEGGQRGTVSDSIDDWMSVDLAGPNRLADEIFSDAVEEIGWMEADPDIDYDLQNLPGLWSDLFDGLFQDVPASTRSTIRSHWDAAGQHAIALRPRECLESLRVAERLLRAQGIDVSAEDVSFSFEEYALVASETFDITRFHDGNKTRLTLAVGSHVLCEPRASFVDAPHREVEVLALSGKSMPEVAHVRFIDSGKQLEVDVSRLWPLKRKR